MRIPDAWTSSARLQGRHPTRRTPLAKANWQRDVATKQRRQLLHGIAVARGNPTAHHSDEFRGGDSENRYRQLFELVARLTQADTLQSALDEVLTASMALVGADAGWIRLFDPDTTDPAIAPFPFVAHVGISKRYLEYFSEVPGNPETRTAIFAGRRVIIEDMTSYPYFRAHLDVVLAERYRSLQTTPLMSADGSKALGCVSTYFLEVYTPPYHTFETLDLYAELAAGAIERHRQTAELKLRELELTGVVGNQRSQLERLGTQLRRAGQRAFSFEPEEIRRLTNSMADTIERWIEGMAQPQLKPDEPAQAEARDHPYGLSGRELEVLLHLWQGLGDKQIAQSIGISRFTVHKHVRSILQKMNVEGRTQAGVQAEREKLFGTTSADAAAA